MKRLNINSMANSSRVYKKTCSNGKLAIYLGKRDFVDHVDMVDPIDGVVLVDPDYLKGRKLFVMLTCAFRYGHDDLDVIGLTFRKDLYVQVQQVFPPEPTSTQGPLTVLQERLLQKLGDNAYPFTLQMVVNLPCSVTLQPGPEDAGKACGIDFEVKSFCAENLEEKISKRDSVRLVVRKVQFAPLEPGPGPCAQTVRHFLLSSQPLQLQAWMDREVHYHGKPISVNVSINNCTNKVIKKIKISVDQITDVVLYSLDKYTKTVFIQEFTETIAANSNFSKSFAVTPLLAANCQKQGLALDGKLKHGDTNLASSTILHSSLQPGMNKELLGILVSYKHPRRPDHQRCWCGAAPDPDASKAITCSEDIVIEEFARQEHRGEESQEALAAEGDEGS
ncbi:arrestin-C isoform X6 [Herpailurus yagouaroundi]|uniref:arrestin-C isoform X6 n=2 Tax=Herpailurus yagouaroundi TaxID=1608482 RepID=UPI001AD6D250|nr:arrestin-C isoform X6 [Puma yagouaroundi]